MRYLGGKQRTARAILEVILPHRQPGQAYVEPFVGGGNVIQHVRGGPRIGGDAHAETIRALEIIRDRVDDLPRNNTEFTEADYRSLLRGETSPWAWLAPFALHAYSFGGCYRAGWAHCTKNTDYVRYAYSAARKQSPQLADVHLMHAPYDQLPIPPKSLIYCDPPYAETSGYKGAGEFDHGSFWQWVRNKHSEGHTVFVSEYSAPADFVSVWHRTRMQNVRHKTNNKRVEQLYVHRTADYKPLQLFNLP